MNGIDQPGCTWSRARSASTLARKRSRKTQRSRPRKKIPLIMTPAKKNMAMLPWEPASVNQQRLRTRATITKKVRM